VIQLPGRDGGSWINGQVCPMLALDIAEFTRADRDEVIQLHLRRCLYGILSEALSESGIGRNQGQYEDRGDGVLVIFPPDLAAQPIVDSFPERLRDVVGCHNRCSCEAARMRLRVAAHLGVVYRDEHGFVGDDVTFLFRMLEVSALRQALSGSDTEIAFMISAWVYAKLVKRRQTPAGRRSFRKVKQKVKGTTVRGRIYLPEA
jgi:hypothetical protein